VHRIELHMDLVAEVDNIVRYLRNKHIGQLRDGNTDCIVVDVSLCPFSMRDVLIFGATVVVGCDDV
jgi:hypothetical protein